VKRLGCEKKRLGGLKEDAMPKWTLVLVVGSKCPAAYAAAS